MHARTVNVGQRRHGFDMDPMDNEVTMHVAVVLRLMVVVMLSDMTNVMVLIVVRHAVEMISGGGSSSSRRDRRGKLGRRCGAAMVAGGAGTR